MIQKTDITLIGGGFSGAALALHLARLAPPGLRVALVEPGKPGHGLAYGSSNPLHRVNVPAERMNLYPEDKGDFHAWFTQETGAFGADPGALGRDGYLYPRRGDFGRYVEARLRQRTAGRLDLSHLQARAMAVEPCQGGLDVRLEDGSHFTTARLVLCNSHGTPDFPWRLDPGTRALPGLITDPWREDVLADLPKRSSVLILGTGLTMADTLAQLRFQGHEGEIMAVSRRGLLPQGHSHFEEAPDFLQGHDLPEGPRGLMKLLRRRLYEGQAQGLPWQTVIEALRKALPQIWSNWSPAARRSALRHLRPYWDPRRFRLAPQVEDVLKEAMDCGQLRVMAGRITEIGQSQNQSPGTGQRFQVGLLPRGRQSVQRRDFDALINCIGPNGNLARSQDPLMQQLQASGQIMADPTGLGLCVDEACHVLDAGGNPQPHLLALGPLTRSRFAEVMGVTEIGIQASELASQLLARMKT